MANTNSTTVREIPGVEIRTAKNGNPYVVVGRGKHAVYLFASHLAALAAHQDEVKSVLATLTPDVSTTPTMPVVSPDPVVRRTVELAASVPTPAPVAVSPPKMTTEETVASIHASQDARKDKTGRPAPKASKGGPKAEPKVTAAPTPTGETLDELKARAKALKIKGAHFFKDEAKLREAIAKATPASTPAAVAVPAPSVTRQPKRTMVTSAKGADGVTYAIYLNADGTLGAVADVQK